MELTENKIRWILIIIGSILFLFGSVAMTPRTEITPEIDMTYFGIGMILLGIFFLFLGVIYPIIEAFKEKKKGEKDFFCPHCGKSLKFSFSK